MLRLLIVDDESATRNGLLHHIDWAHFGITMIQTAGSGQEALAICEHFKPDIILSDIRMRGMDGVVTCTILHERFPYAQIIFISGYSDKEYFKAAIELGVVHYVEKPVNTPELQRAVSKAIDVLKRIQTEQKNREAVLHNTEYLKHRTFFTLISNPCIKEEDIQLDIKLSGLMDHGKPYMRIVLLKTSSQVTNIQRFTALLEEAAGSSSHPEHAVCFFSEFTDNRNMVIAFAGNRNDLCSCCGLLAAYVRAGQSKIDNYSVFLAFGTVVDSYCKLYESHQQALNSLTRLFHLGYGQTAKPMDALSAYEPDLSICDEFRHALQNGEQSEIEKAVNKIARILRQNGAIRTDGVMNIFFTLDYEISQQYRLLFTDQDFSGQEASFSKLEAMDNIDDMTEFITMRTRELLKTRTKDESGNSVIARVIRHMHKEYAGKNISVRQLAEEVYLTPTYLSTLFKRKTGKTIGEYLTDIRMEKAKELLGNSQLKLYHIAEMVGYDDANYFAKIFKKQTGVTPSEYRENL